MLLAGDFDPALRAAFPGAVRAALSGDPAPLLRLSRRAFAVDGEPPPPRILSTALYAATSCEETPSRGPATRRPTRPTGAATAAAGGRPARSRVRPLRPGHRSWTATSSTCAAAGRATGPPGRPGPLPDVPVLLLEGEDDLRTPVENARRVAALFPRRSLVVAPATGHSVLGSDLRRCAGARSTASSGAAGAHPLPAARGAFPPASAAARLSRVSRLPRRHGIRGRTLAAVRLTLRDVRRTR